MADRGQITGGILDGPLALDNAISPMALNPQSMGLPGATDFRSMNTPSVWRTRTAAAKVDARASNGMDEIEIPAFLRKQAD